GKSAMEVELDAGFGRAIELHRTVMDVEMAHNFRRDYQSGGDKLSLRLRTLIERGREVRAVDYCGALSARTALGEALDPLFDEYDAIVTPAAPGPAPRGLDSTGDPAFCSMWTWLGVPTVSLPLLLAPSGLPIGVQLVGRRGNDARLLRTARWLVDMLGRQRRRPAARARKGSKR
ncbi:MAG TPA: amidase family protein, partial [Vineibacter sp.]|nr:amidase family protein [Vineibacter sp.]